MFLLKKRDFAVIGIILLGAIALIVFLRPSMLGLSPVPGEDQALLQQGQEEGKAENQAFPNALAFLQITVGQSHYAPYPLVGEGALTLTQKDGQENVIHYTPTSFYMHASTCEGQDCIAQGEVTFENISSRPFFNSVICLPNQVSVALITPQEAKVNWEQYYGIQ